MEQEGSIERLLRRDRLVLIALIATLFGVASLYTILGIGMRMSALDMTAMSGMSDMPGGDVAGSWNLNYMLLVFLMWWIMMIAMMLPSASPTVLLYSALSRRSAEASRVPSMSAAFLSGYLVAWAGFSVLATVMHRALESWELVSSTMMTLIDTVPGALLLLTAGIFQFTPLKHTCLQHCRSPAEFITRRRRPGAGGAFQMGLEHGSYCLGCCWSLMALLFVGGVMNLYWIAALAGLVAVEKLVPRGELVSKAAGAVLMVWGSYLLVVALGR